MPFDGFVLAAVRQELEEKISGSRIDKIYQPTLESLVLNLRRSKKRMKLFLSAHPNNARVHLISQQKENPLSPPLFCMVLRKYLEGGRIKSVVQPGLERILILEVEIRDEGGLMSIKHLICETMGKHSNIILVDAQTQQIIDASRRYSHVQSRHREVLPGRQYISPPSQQKMNPMYIDDEKLYESLITQPLDKPLANCLQSCLDGFSQTLGNEIVFRAGLPVDITLNECGVYEFQKVWLALREVIAPAGQNKFDPSLIVDNNGKPIEFAACNLTSFAGHDRVKDTMNKLVEFFFSERETDTEREKERHFLLKLLRKEISRLAKKISLQREYLSETVQTEKHRIFGELLMANLHIIERGISQIALENFYERNGSPVSISLQPHLSPLENAQAYFKKYSKAKQACKMATTIIQQAEKDLTYLQGVETALQQASSMQELLEIRQELGGQGFLKEKNKLSQGKKGIQSSQQPQPLIFFLSEGFTALVGKTNRQNDYLTMRLAEDNDIWLHAKDIPGAHVVIRTGHRESTPLALQEAACLAAYYSRARQSSNVAVDYTLRKNVNKPRGAKPGFVTYIGQRTINAKPDKDLVDHLLKNQRTLF